MIPARSSAWPGSLRWAASELAFAFHPRRATRLCKRLRIEVVDNTLLRMVRQRESSKIAITNAMSTNRREIGGLNFRTSDKHRYATNQKPDALNMMLRL